MKKTKRIARWMAILMFVMSFQGVQIVKADDGFNLVQKSLSNQKGELEWKLENVGTSYREQIYTFEYYLPIAATQDESKKIEIEMDMQQSNINQQADITLSILDTNGVKETLYYIDQDENTSTQQDTFTKQISVDYTNSNQFLAKERRIHVRLAEYGLELSLEVDRETVTFSTTRMEEGYLIPFTLTSGTKTQETLVFTGLNTFEINPLHIREDGTKEDKIVSDALGKEVPGSKPGVEINFELPKRLKGDNTGFEDLQFSWDVGARLRIEDTMDRTTVNETILLDSIQDGQEYTLSKAQTKGTLTKSGELYTLYLADEEKTNTTGAKVGVWPSLQASMLLNGSFEFWEKGTQELYADSAQGHTFVKYEIIKTLEGEHMKILPYNVNFPVEYTVQATDPLGGDIHNIAPFGEGIKNTITSAEEFIVDLDFLTGSIYRIVIDGARTQGQIHSLQYHYVSSEHTFTVDPPSIVSIDKVYLIDRDIESEQLSGDKKQVSAGFDITWSARGIENFLTQNGGSLYYQLYLQDQLDGASQDLIHVVQITLDDEVGIVVKGQAGEGGENTPILNANGTFTLHNIKLKNYGEEDWIGFELDEQTYPLDATWSEYPTDGITPVTGRDYTIPGRYYVSMNAVYEPSSGDVTRSNLSYPESLVLQKRKEIVPLPETVEIIETEEENILSKGIYFSNIDIRSYAQYMLNPVRLSLGGAQEVENEKIYEIYLYQQGQVQEKHLEEAVLQQEVQDGDEKIILTDQQQTLLRQQGGVLRFDYRTEDIASQNFRMDLESFDPNQGYYVQIRTRLDLFDVEEGEAFGNRYSSFSKIYSFTTGTKPIPPTPDEQAPPAAKDFFIVEQENNQTVRMGWEPAEFTEEELEQIYYEMIRVEDNELSGVDLNRNQPLEDLLLAAENRKGFKTKVNGVTNIHVYEEGNWVQLNPIQNALNLRLLDDTLKPNTLYYYYLRTVKGIGEEEIASDWIMLPVTTSPIGKPIHLKVEDEEDYAHDLKRETVISFWAPIPSDASVPQDYDFQIGVKGPKDDEFSFSYDVSKIEEEVLDSYYTRYVYHITGLKPGNRYDVKVRVEDKTKEPEEGEDYPTSLYSESIAIRTDYDEEDAIRDDKYEEYLKKYDEAAEALRRKEYWIIDEGVYKYRTQYIDASLAVQNQYALVTQEDQSEQIYYMPISAIYQMNANKTTLVIEIEDTKLYIRPNTLSEELEEIKEAIKQVEERRLEDYYVAIQVSRQKITKAIQQEQPLSSEIRINFDLVYIDEEDRLIEEAMMHELNQYILAGREDVIDQLEYIILERGRLEEDELEAMIQEVIEKVQQKHQKRAGQIIEKTMTKNIILQNIQTPLLLVLETTAYHVNAYYYNRAWELVYTFSSMGGFAIEAKQLGTYVFTGKENQGVLPGVTGAQMMVGKYQLAEFFAIEDTEKMGWYTTKAQVYGSLARILGANKDQEPISYLQLRGIKGVNRIGNAQAIRSDEAIYLMMQAYEKLNGVDIKTITIRNKQSVLNISAFQSHYIPYVYSAVELGVITPMNQKVQPSDGISALKAIEMLTKIVPK